MTRRRIDDDQRGQVVDLLRQGKGRNEISRLAGVGAGSVSRIAQAASISITPAGVDRSALNNLLAAARAYDRARRLALYNRAMERAEEMLADPALSPRGLQAVVTSQAIADDKVKVLLGEQRVMPEQQTNILIVVGDNGRGPSPDQVAALTAPPVVDVAARHVETDNEGSNQ